MEKYGPTALDLRQEKACAALCFAIVLPFTLLVLLEGSVAPAEFLKLAAAFIGIALLLAGAAFLPFAGVELVKSGLRSGWKERSICGNRSEVRGPNLAHVRGRVPSPTASISDG